MRRVARNPGSELFLALRTLKPVPLDQVRTELLVATKTRMNPALGRPYSCQERATRRLRRFFAFGF